MLGGGIPPLGILTNVIATILGYAPADFEILDAVVGDGGEGAALIKASCFYIDTRIPSRPSVFKCRATCEP